MLVGCVVFFYFSNFPLKIKKIDFISLYVTVCSKIKVCAQFTKKHKERMKGERKGEKKRKRSKEKEEKAGEPVLALLVLLHGLIILYYFSLTPGSLFVK